MMKVMVQFKKMIASVLVLVLVATSITTSAFAAPPAGSYDVDAYNTELLRLLEEEYGAEQAAAMVEMVQKLGLVDDQGQLLSYSILLNGENYTLDEIKQVLDDPVTDLTQIALVDGDPITLAVLREMIAIEERLSALTSIGTETSLSTEHLDSLDSLLSQAEGEGGLPFLDQNGSVLASTYGSSTFSNSDYGDETVVSVTSVEETRAGVYPEVVKLHLSLIRLKQKRYHFPTS